jgi:hypothetical protein
VFSPFIRNALDAVEVASNTHRVDAGDLDYVIDVFDETRKR